MTPSTSTDGTPRKAVLFCPDCGHESPPDGDWAVRRRGGRTVLTCPDCGTTVTTRGRSRVRRVA